MEQLTTYTIKSRNSPNVWQFKYHLNGNLAEFKILEGNLTEVQVQWLRDKGYFPFYEAEVKEWQSKLKANFEITIGEPDLSFEALWLMYDHKVSKADAIKSFKKLKEGEVIQCFMAVPKYLDWLKRNPGIGKLHLATFINKRRFEDELPEAPPVYKKPFVGKNFNSAIAELAAKKTDK